MRRREPDPRGEGETPPSRAPKRLRPLRRLLWGVQLGRQLSALYTLLLVATLSLVGSVVYSQQETFLVQNVADRLKQEALRIVALPTPPNQPSGGDGGPGQGGYPDQQGPSGGPPADPLHHLMENLVRGLTGPDISVAILDTQGNVISTTQALEGASAPVIDPVNPQRAAAALKSLQPVQWIASRSDGTRHVILLMSVTWRSPGPGNASQSASGTGSEPATSTFLVEQSASLAPTDAALDKLRTYLLLGVIGGTLAGIVLVLAFTRIVLRSLDRVAHTADAIASGDLHRRLQLPPGRNEVARLGKAFDYMVGRLVSTLQAQRRFIADASHELRTPLTSLKGMAEILVIGAHGNDTQVVEQSAQAINGELERLIRLVNDLLMLSRLNSGDPNSRSATRHSRMNVCETMSAATTQMAGLAEARGVTLRQECPQPLWISGDAGQMKQVFLNLIDNALRHTPAGGEVTLRGTADGGSARLEVQDTGSGISERDLPHIFERFYRGDVSRTRATGNTGLGLAIVQGIVEAHDGSIGVTSTPGAGTCFTIRLPLMHDQPVEQQAAASSRTAQ